MACTSVEVISVRSYHWLRGMTSETLGYAEDKYHAASIPNVHIRG